MKIVAIITGACAALICGFFALRADGSLGPESGPAVQTAVDRADDIALDLSPPALRVAISTKRAAASRHPHDDASIGEGRRPFKDLGESVQNFVVQAIEDWHDHRSAAVLDKVNTQGVHALNAEDFSAVVRQMKTLRKAARTQYLEAIEDTKERYRSTADPQRYLRFDSDQTFQAELAKEDEFYRIADEGEEERADGTPRYRRGVLVIDLDEHRELKDVKEYFEGFKIWQGYLRHDARGLLAGLK